MQNIVFSALIKISIVFFTLIFNVNEILVTIFLSDNILARLLQFTYL